VKRDEYRRAGWAQSVIECGNSRVMNEKILRVGILLTPAIPLNLDICGGVERVALTELELVNQAGIKTRLFAFKVTGKDYRVLQVLDLSWKNRFLKFFYHKIR